MRDRLAENWWLLTIRGVAGILFGILALVLPGITLFALVLLFGAYAFVDGLFALTAAIRRRTYARWGALALEGLLGILVGIVTLVWPQITAVALLAVIAAWAIITGILEIAAAIRLRTEIQGEWLLALSGALSVVFGVILVMRPTAGALAVVTIIGIYAIVFGALMLWLGLKARGMARPGQVRAVGATN
jgi:uncharacterized membrane protein HdeD (DUF308 family)